MTGVDAAAEIRVRKLTFGDPVLIDADRVLVFVGELVVRFGNTVCPACGRDLHRLSEDELRLHLRRSEGVQREFLARIDCRRPVL